jgi:hypothetical protein
MVAVQQMGDLVQRVEARRLPGLSICLLGWVGSRAIRRQRQGRRICREGTIRRPAMVGLWTWVECFCRLMQYMMERK